MTPSFGIKAGGRGRGFVTSVAKGLMMSMSMLAWSSKQKRGV
jgi:hypothetical protein